MALTAALVAAGCQGPTRPAGAEGVVPTYNASTGRLERISYDRNKDGKADAWLRMDGTRATSAELDENYDGAVDRWEFFSDAAAPVTPGGILSRSRSDASARAAPPARYTICGCVPGEYLRRPAMAPITAAASEISSAPKLAQAPLVIAGCTCSALRSKAPLARALA